MERWSNLFPLGVIITVIGLVRILFGPNLHTPISAAQLDQRLAEEVRMCVERIDTTQRSLPQEWQEYAAGAKQDCAAGW